MIELSTKWYVFGYVESRGIEEIDIWFQMNVEYKISLFPFLLLFINRIMNLSR